MTTLTVDRAAINRLQFIAQVCPSLTIQALTIALRHVKTGRDTSLYQAILGQLATAAGQDCANAEFDRAWIERTTAQNAADKDKLETELKMYTGNMIKESVRVSSSLILGETRRGIDAE
jgi:COP9 signalosome complex subunit 1